MPFSPSSGNNSPADWSGADTTAAAWAEFKRADVVCDRNGLTEGHGGGAAESSGGTITLSVTAVPLTSRLTWPFNKDVIKIGIGEQ